MFQSIGASRMVVDETINRDFTTLRNIRNAFGNGVELIVNVICHKNCIFEMFHHNQTSHDNHSNKENPSVSYYSHMCMLQRCDRPSTLLKLNWIRPEDISLYVRETRYRSVQNSGQTGGTKRTNFENYRILHETILQRQPHATSGFVFSYQPVSGFFR